MYTDKTPKPFTLIIGGKDACFRKGFSEMLRRSKLIEVKKSAHEIGHALELIDEYKSNTVLLNEDMEGINGKCSAAIIKEKFPLIKIFVVSNHYTREKLHELELKGVNGFLLMNTDKKEVEKAFGNGDKIFYANEIYRQIMDAPVNKMLATFLTEREQDVFWPLIKGMSVKKIEELLHITPATIYGYRKTILNATKTENEAGLLIWALKNKIVTAEEVVKW